MSTIGERTKKIRNSLNLTQIEFAKSFGFSHAFLSAIEKDKSCFSVNHLTKLCLEYNVNINYLLVGKGEMFIKEQPAGLKEEIKQAVKEMFNNGELFKD